MSERNDAGFTMVELMIAIVVLAIGVTALAGTSGFVTRQIGRSRLATIATEVGTRRLELLKLAAAPNGATAACASAGFANGGPVTAQGVTESWTVIAAGTLRTATVTVTYPRGAGGTSTQTFQTVIGCYYMRARHGFTLVELLVVMVLFLIVSGATFSLLTNTQRVSRAQAERTDMQTNMRAGALIVPAELRTIGYDRDVTGTGNAAGTVMSDILGMAADSIAFRAVRSSGIICNTAANSYVIDNGGAGFYTGYRAPVPGRDTLMVFGEMDPSRDGRRRVVPEAHHRQRRRQLRAAAYGSRAGTTLVTVDAVPGDSITLGAPFHTFEVMSYKLIQGADNRWYLNARSLSGRRGLPADARSPRSQRIPARLLRRERKRHRRAKGRADDPRSP